MLDLFLVQFDVALGQKQQNFDKILKLTENISSKNGIIILPEMFATGYLPLHPEHYAEEFSGTNLGETSTFLNKLAQKTQCAVIGGGICLKNNGLFNGTSVFLPKNAQEFYHYNKCHPFFMEQKKFFAGKSQTTFDYLGWKIATSICFDLRFPELYRDFTKKGAKLVTVQAAWPLKRIAHWKILLQARAIENQIYIAGVNCLGNGQGGCSMVVNPQGEIIAEAYLEEKVLHATIEMAPQIEYRKSFPVLKDIVPTDLI